MNTSLQMPVHASQSTGLGLSTIHKEPIVLEVKREAKKLSTKKEAENVSTMARLPARQSLPVVQKEARNRMANEAPRPRNHEARNRLSVATQMIASSQKVNAIIQILSQNDSTETLANQRFGKQPWARLLRIPDNVQFSQKSLFENALFTDLLEPLRKQWITKDFVGCLSQKATQKINLTKLDSLLSHGVYRSIDLNQCDAVFFLCMGHDVSLIKGHPKFTTIWNTVVRGQCKVTEEKHAVCNYFMVRPIQMQAQMSIFNNVLWPGIEAMKEAHEDSLYKVGKIEPDRLLLITGKPQQTHHTFVAERFGRPYFLDRKFIVGCL